MNEIPSPAQTYSGALLPPASEWSDPTLLLPVRPDWHIRAYDKAFLYGIEVVTLTKRRYYSGTADAIYELWAHGDKACQIENLCDECKGRGENRTPDDRESYDCPYCEGRGWFYAD